MLTMQRKQSNSKTKKCKNCGDQFSPVKFLQKFCLKEECIRVWVEIEKQKQWKAKKTRLKKELMSLQDWLKLAQMTFNKWIRHRDKGMNCISCDKPAKKENCGHYFSQGGHANVRFDEDNCHLQCEHCNTYLSGNLLNYQIGIEKRIGGERLIALHERAHVVKKWTIDECKAIIETYKMKLKE
jgi:hypothetical protein